MDLTGHLAKFAWVYGLLALGGCVGAVGDAFLNQWARTGHIVWLLIAFALSVGSVSIFAWVLKSQAFPFGAAVALGLVIHSILAVILDRAFFGGHFSISQRVGLVCAVAAIVLITPRSHAKPFDPRDVLMEKR